MAKQLPSSRSSLGVLLALLFTLTSGILPGIGESTDVVGPMEAPTDVPVSHQAAELEGMIDELTVAAERPRTGYSRAAFKHWIDADGNGCDTRGEVLERQSKVPTTVEGRCKITAGEWFSAYDGLTFEAPGGLDIDHLVPLGEAWDSDASSWDDARRQDYANNLESPEALIAVSAGSNRSKSDRDPAEWKPSRPDYWCQYALDWVSVKLAEGLTADESEIEALREMAATCDDAAASTTQ